MNPWIAFLTGLSTGGLTCLAVQGGLLASVIANQKLTEQKDKQLADSLLPVGMFLSTKLVAYTVLGGLLGWLGSFLTLSLSVQLAFQALSGLFLFATALNLLEVHPIFRWVTLQPPRSLQRLIRLRSKSADLFAPAVLGVLTIFIPCGVTQAMEVVAINTGSPTAGALLLFAFTLGTFPLFAGIGLATTKLSTLWNTRFLRAAAILLLVLSLSTFNGLLVVMNAPITAQKIISTVTSIGAPPEWYIQKREDQPQSTVVIENGIQKSTIRISSNGYSPKKIRLKKGVPTELTLETNETFSCASSFVLKKFDITAQLKPTDKQTFAFVPQESGTFPFSCAMGMFSGEVEVI